jgi:hypothetical protein
LELATRQRGIEQLLERWHFLDFEPRQATVQKIEALRQQLFETYGEMPDSVDIIREDRGRVSTLARGNQK